MGGQMFLVRRFTQLVLAILTVVTVLAVTAGQAAATTGSVQFPGPATRIAQGVALDVPVSVSVTCDEGYTLFYIQLGVGQARGNVGVSGSGFSPLFPCDGTVQNFTQRVTGGIFHAGTALATAVVEECQANPDFGYVCIQTDIIVSQVIKIRG